MTISMMASLLEKEEIVQMSHIQMGLLEKCVLLVAYELGRISFHKAAVSDGLVRELQEEVLLLVVVVLDI
jgi:hypothetical protein